MKSLRVCYIFVCVACLVCGLTFAGDLPTGHFTGSGQWHALDGASGTYTTSLTITSSRLTHRSTWEQEGEEKEMAYSMTLVVRGPGFFDLADEQGVVIGQLACLGSRCSYALEQDGAHVRESPVFSDDGLSKFGSKVFDEYRIVWAERLTAE